MPDTFTAVLITDFVNALVGILPAWTVYDIREHIEDGVAVPLLIDKQEHIDELANQLEVIGYNVDNFREAVECLGYAECNWDDLIILVEVL